jgi:glyoxylase-like metal-dependent hydrolase (beta-lactamase superfamily II)
MLGRMLLMAVLGLQAAMAVALELVPVSERVYAIVGETAQRSPENLGNNATFGLVETDEGLILVDPGGSEKGAAAIERVIRQVSDRPVRIVINTGGQDHRWIGNHYWKSRGARIIASNAAVTDQKARVRDQFTGLLTLVGEAGMEGTEPVFADDTFDRTQQISLGGVQLEIRHEGQAHTPGDSFVWLPAERVVFSGDIVYHDRALGVGPQSHSGRWLEAFARMAELDPQVVVPGHGRPGGLEKSRKETEAYLQALRNRIAGFIDEGGVLEEIRQVDFSDFGFLEVFEQISGRNAQQVFQEMEFE